MKTNTLVFPNICHVGVRQPNVFSSCLCQALWLDADEGGVKAAKGAGMKAVLVTNLDEVLEKVSSFTGIQVKFRDTSSSLFLLLFLLQVVTIKARGICHKQP